ncbi:MAG: ATP-binding protein [Deltaproteobacteria bacterium]|nr:ATP-binding protein [Deltaproteobacteria bacterium]
MARPLRTALAKPYVHVLFGARQTGKSTLLRELVPEADLWIDLSHPGERSRYLARPERLIEQCEALPTATPRRRGHIVVIDEAQAVPALFDAVQYLYDRDRARWRFVLSGSSARKLRLTGANLLPGRSLLHRLYPLVTAERPARVQAGTSAGKILPLGGEIDPPPFPPASLLERLVWGDLPGIALAPTADREEVLRSYAYVYLEEELRREGLIKDWAPFARFLRLAALESGKMINYAKLAKDAGTSAPTVKSHYQLLEDMFIGVRLEAFTGSARKQVLETPRFLFFDLGVRHAAADLSVTPDTVLANPGPVFEQWVGIELWKRLQYRGRGRLTYLRTKGGLEVDFVVDLGDRLIPVEAKWTDNPSRDDARHLVAFLSERPRRSDSGFVVCRCPRAQQIAPNVTAIPWWAM